MFTIINRQPPVAVIPTCERLIIRPLYGAGAKGQAGPGVISSATHFQGVAQQVWTFNHDLNYVPAVTTFDSNGDEIFGEVTHPTVNQSVITFAFDVSGRAYAS